MKNNGKRDVINIKQIINQQMTNEIIDSIVIALFIYTI